MDRISLLSDSLLHHILSFLNIKSVVQTCVLSKRWKTLWTDIPTLNFDFDSYPFEQSTGNGPYSKYSSIKRFIFRVFSEHRCESIKKLSYSSSIHTEEAVLVVELLICYTRHHPVQELCINTFNTVYFDWPLDLLECSSLTVLKMTCGFLDDWVFEELLLPLRILEIGYEWGDGDAKYNVNWMLSECPSLESLVLVNCLSHNVSIEAPELKNFELSISSSQWYLRFPKVELLTPKLKSVKFCNVLPTVTSDSEFSCIHEVNIAVDDSDFDGDGSATQKLTENFSQLLQVFHNARSFTLPFKAMEVLLSVPSSLSRCSFHNLRYLKLKTEATNKIISLPISRLMNSLKCSNLEMLDFEVDPNQREIEQEQEIMTLKAREAWVEESINASMIEMRAEMNAMKDMRAEVNVMKDMLRPFMESRGGSQFMDSQGRDTPNLGVDSTI